MSDKPITTMFHSEVQLAGWSESHNGGCKVTFWLAQPSDLDAFRAMTVRKGNTAGQRLACALVEIGDDEQPVQSEPAEKPKGGALAKLAGMWCHDRQFHDWLRGPRGVSVEDAEEAAQFIRSECGVESRAELDGDETAAKIFHERIRVPYAEYLRKMVATA